MIIKKYKVENFRSIKKEKIEIKNNFLQLIGENNSGKTNLLLALRLFFSKSIVGLSKSDFFKEKLNKNIIITITFEELNHSERDFFERYIINDKIKLKKVFSINEETERTTTSFEILQEYPDLCYFSEEYLSTWNENKSEIENWIEENNHQNYFYNEKGKLTKTSFKVGIHDFLENETNIDMRKIWCKSPFQWKEVVSILPELLYIEATKHLSEEMKTTIKSKSIYKKILEKIILEEIKQKETSIEDFQNSLDEIKQKINKIEDSNDNRFQIIKDIELKLKENLNKNILTKNLEIKFLTPKFSDFFSNSEIFIDDGINSSIEEKGDGIKRSLIFALFLTYSRYLRAKQENQNNSTYRPFIFLIEEPELYLHPQAQKELLNILYTISTYDQVLYTTHSTHFISIENYLSLILVSKNNLDIGTKIKRIQSEIFELESKEEFNMLMRFNPERNEMFFAKKIILIEGDVEKIILNGISDLLDNNLNTSNISVIECGGKYNLIYFLKILSHFDRPIVLIHDVDPLTEEESKDIEELREGGLSEDRIEKIKRKKKNFKENERIKNYIRNFPNKIGLITIDPNFEVLIGISPNKRYKPYKAFKYLNKLKINTIPSNIKKIIQFILDFTISSRRRQIKEEKIICDS